MTEKAVIYLRVSTDEQTEESQLEPCKNYCKEKGWEVVKIYRDHGKSAYKENIIRPQFEQMLKDAERQQFQHIVVFNLDRFSRQPARDVLALIKKLSIMYGVQVNAVYGDEWRDVVDIINRIPNMGVVGTAIAEFIEKLLVGLQARQARLESEKISMRVKASKRFQKAKKENKVGRPQVEIDVNRIVELKEGNPPMSYRKIGQQLGIPKSTVEKYYKETVQKRGAKNA